MLPTLLSADLCSLHQQQDRYALSVMWEFKDDRVVDTWYGRTLIRSKYALHYDQAQAIIDGVTIPPVAPIPGRRWEEAQIDPKEFDQLRENLTILQRLGVVLHERRESHGAVALESLDQVTMTLNKNKEPTKIETKHDGLIHHTVAEWMIFANSSVAAKIHSVYPTSTLMRIHPTPKHEKFASLLKAAQARGYHIRFENNNALAKSLALAVDPQDKYVNMLLRSLATKAMEEAQYVSSGSIDQYYHYGLALDYYTHFTSPIRRYADIIVHRQLLQCISDTGNIVHDAELRDMALHMNNRKRAADRAQQESTEWFRAIYFKNKTETVDGIVFAVKGNSISVFLPQYYIKGYILFVFSNQLVQSIC
jgi:DIS3-like exonuclease 1